MKGKIYLAISLDKYELPLAVFECVKDIAIWSGLVNSALYKSIRRHSIDKKNKCRYVRVDISDDLDSDDLFLDF